MDTIFALATATGRAGVSVVRMSGPKAKATALILCKNLPEPRQVGLRMVNDVQGEPIDHALVLVFEGPNSFTGEDVVELHLHGSIAIVRSVLETLGQFDGLRLAEAGEFTRRALENGRLDLARVEGLADLIDAETEAQRKQALRVLSGHLGNLVDGWREALIRAAALLEATIDFVDEDVPIDVMPEVDALLSDVSLDLAKEIAGTKIAERIRTGFEVAIVGPPNVGKSTLLNALAGREAAITSEIAGTTRDVIEVRMDLGGLPVTVLDTAGLRDGIDQVEKIGIERAIARAQAADLRVFLLPDGQATMLNPVDGDIVVRPKGDLFKHSDQSVSGLTGQGVDTLVSKIQDVLDLRSGAIGTATHERHRIAMIGAERYLQAAREICLAQPDQPDLAAEELRFAVRALETLVGRIGVENLLDEIFSSFCIGK